MSAKSLAEMLGNRIKSQADAGAERLIIPFFLAEQIYRFLTEASHGSQLSQRLTEADPDVGDPSGDRRRDWGLRAREIHLEGLSARAAGGTWFAVTNGADGLARIDNGTDGMWPIRCEWPEAELIEELVNALRRGEVVLRRPIAQGTEARQGRDACGSVHDGPVGEAEAPSIIPHPLHTHPNPKREDR